MWQDCFHSFAKQRQKEYLHAQQRSREHETNPHLTRVFADTVDQFHDENDIERLVARGTIRAKHCDMWNEWLDEYIARHGTGAWDVTPRVLCTYHALPASDTVYETMTKLKRLLTRGVLLQPQLEPLVYDRSGLAVFETNNFYLPQPGLTPCWLAAMMAATATPMESLGTSSKSCLVLILFS